MADEEKKEQENEEQDLTALTATLAGMADNVEGMEARLKEQYGKDLKAAQDEMDEKRTTYEERTNKLLEKLAAPALGDGKEPEEYCGYGKDGMGAFIQDVYRAGQPGGGMSERLVKMQKFEMERRDLSTLSGGDGGFFMAPQWSNELLRLPDEGAYLRKYCRELLAGTPPNSPITLPYLDQGGSKGVYGGVTVYSAKEAENTTNLTTPKVGLVTLKPEKIGADYILTEELRANAPTMAQLMPDLLQGGISGYLDDKIESGTGAGELLGFRGCSAEISVERSIADEVNYIDTVNMLARILTRGSYVWVCQRVGLLPQLMTLTDGAGHLIWTQDAVSGIPGGRLQGLPLFYDEIGPALGDAGDLVLVDLSYYLLKPGMPVQIKSDQTYGNFRAGKETIKATFYMDGKPWLQEPLTLRDGTNTVSPFVSLAA
jgi:HK97 family phage major capsid protein